MVLWPLVSFCGRFDAQGGLFFNSFLAVLPYSPLNRIQTGSVVMDSASKNVAVAATNMGQSFVYCFGHAPASDQSNNVTCRLSSPSEVVIEAGAGNNQNVYWGLVEFALNAFVQRGTASLPAAATQTDIAIAGIDPARTFVLVDSRTGNVNLRDRDEERTVRANLTSGSNLHLERNESGIATDITYQVIQLNSARVQPGLYTLATTSGTVTINSVDRARSVLFFNLKASADSDGIDNRFYVRGRFSAANTIAFDRRGTAGSVDISYYAVELNDASVQSGTVTTTGLHDQTVLDVTLPSPVIPERTLPVISNTVVEILDLLSNADQDSGRYSGVFTSGTNLRVTRSSAEERPSEVDWFTVQFSGLGL